MTSIRKWADEHQYDAEPHDTATEHNGVQSKVYLLGMTADPLGQMAAFANIYRGKVDRSLSTVTDDERRSALADMMVTELQQPMEVVKMHFLLEGVDRAFTHQHVRQRMAGYGQESMRFAVLGDLLDATTLPPGLHGTERSGEGDIMPMGQQAANRYMWDKAIKTVDEAYHFLVTNGMAAEEARGLLPHATATRIHYDVDLRNFSEMAGKRLCTQAQLPWRGIFGQMIQAIAEYTPDWSWMTDGEGKSDSQVRAEVAVRQAWEDRYRWQFEAIAQSALFRPICYKTGKCEFQAATDRTCSIKTQVTIRHKHGGTDSEQWHKPFMYQKAGGFETSPGINPAEWLVNANAARKVGG